MSIIKTTPQYTLIKWGVIAALLLASHAWVWHATGQAAERKHALAQAKIQAEHLKALQAAIAFNEEVSRAQDTFNRGVIKDYETRLAALQRTTGRLRINAQICRDALAADVASPGQDHGTGAATVLLPQRTSEDLDRLVDRADRLAEQLRITQEWIAAHDCRLKTP